MTTLTATPDPDSGTVALTIDNAAGVTGIVRADTNGTREVRFRAGEFPAAGTLTITDHEAALSGALCYRLRGLVSDPVWTELAADLPQFILPTLPSFSVVADLVHGYSSARQSRATFHTVIGRTDPVVAEGRLASRSGTLDVWFAEYLHAKNLEDMLERGQVVMYRQAEHPGMDMYFHAESVAVTPDEDSWKLSLSYVEVGFPAGEILIAKTWTFDELAAVGVQFDEVRKDYRTFADLTINEAGA